MPFERSGEIPGEILGEIEKNDSDLEFFRDVFGVLSEKCEDIFDVSNEKFKDFDFELDKNEFLFNAEESEDIVQLFTNVSIGAQLLR